ncbi:isochorismatase family protein [Embleya sp. NPDC127516]|uniref:isochorismatase family protein n=1 Tax=Embleya sp. NPDC127516 TaxID=3363990 RepID=UPI00380F3951
MPTSNDRDPAHAWCIPEREYERHERRRGRRWAYPHLDPHRTALVVIDMVPFFTEANPYARGIVSRIRNLAAHMRSAGGTVAWVLPEPTPNIEAAREFYGPTVAALYLASGGTGPVEQRLSPGLTPVVGDRFAAKTAHSAFFPGRCPLPGLLEARGITTILITGTTTDVCCESSARDAFTLGYRVIVVADATATGTDHAHNASLRTVYRSLGDVRTTRDLITLLACPYGVGKAKGKECVHSLPLSTYSAPGGLRQGPRRAAE